MATPLTDSINALTAYANEVTGQSDTNLSDAVHTLASGYGGGEEFITLADTDLTNTTNVDAYFAELIDGWTTDIILIYLDSTPTLYREFIGCWSQYAYSLTGGFQQIWRRNNSKDQYEGITRSNYAINTEIGKKYKVIRFKNLFA